MRAARLFILALASIVTFPVLAISGDMGHASILPEVQKHLDEARDGITNGELEIANAHADLILVSDDVKYCVQYVSVPEKLRPRCSKALGEALDEWQQALDKSIKFHKVDDPETADVVVRFKVGVMMGNEPVAGYANWKRTLKQDGSHVQVVSFKSDLQIRTLNLDGQPMPFDCVRHEIAHEFGHILGLEDSERTGDLMGPLDIDHPVGGPQTYEADAVRQLRADARRIKADALVTKQ